jgi:hypothetical protein
MEISAAPDPNISIYPVGGRGRPVEALLRLSFLNNEPDLTLRSGRVNLSGPYRSGVLLTFDEGRSVLSLRDSEGFESDLGGSSLVTTKTGETHERSAASLVLFDKDGKVLWSAP